jgi:outer membrane protein OmpA-like peptidoglycan-associated protein
VIQESGNRTIIKQDNRVIIRNDDSDRWRRVAPDARSSRRSDGSVETFFVRPDGTRVVTVVDNNGRLLHRYRRDPRGREVVIIDNRRFYRPGVAIAAGALGFGLAVALAAPRVAIAREKYIVDYDRASDDDLYEALTAPPIERLGRAYSLEEIRYSHPLRERMRRVDLDTITFDFGAWEVAPEQYGRLERVGRAIQRVLARNPEEVFLIEGHTDAVGQDDDNLSLSDRRAQSVAEILTSSFQVPPENLVTQGYGEQFLKVDTQNEERTNRRVAVRRITPLMSQQLQDRRR